MWLKISFIFYGILCRVIWFYLISLLFSDWCIKLIEIDLTILGNNLVLSFIRSLITSTFTVGLSMLLLMSTIIPLIILPILLFLPFLIVSLSMGVPLLRLGLLIHHLIIGRHIWRWLGYLWMCVPLLLHALGWSSISSIILRNKWFGIHVKITFIFILSSIINPFIIRIVDLIHIHLVKHLFALALICLVIIALSLAYWLIFGVILLIYVCVLGRSCLIPTFLSLHYSVLLHFLIKIFFWKLLNILSIL